MHLGEPAIDVDVFQISIDKSQPYGRAVVDCLELSQTL